MVRRTGVRRTLAAAALAAAAVLSGPGSAQAAGGPVSLSEQGGPDTGGTILKVHGTGLDRAFIVRFGATQATYVQRVSPTELIVRAPAGTGTVDVSVEYFGGTRSANTAADDFTYRAARNRPTVSMLGPNRGSVDGSDIVTITGTNFVDVTNVQFGFRNAVFFVVSPTEMRVATPIGGGHRRCRGHHP